MWRQSLYEHMAEIGFTQPEVDEMDAWLVASFLGHGPEGDGANYRPVFRGVRQVEHRKDAYGVDQGASLAHVTSLTDDDRRAAFKKPKGQVPT